MTLAFVRPDTNSNPLRSTQERGRKAPRPLEDTRKPTGASSIVAGELHRAASYTHFPPIREVPEVTLSFSEADLVPSDKKWHDGDDYDLLDLEPEDDDSVHTLKAANTAPLQTRSRRTVSSIFVGSEAHQIALEDAPETVLPMLHQQSKDRQGKLTRTLSALGRKQKDPEPAVSVSKLRRDTSPLAVRPPTPPRAGSRSPSKRSVRGEDTLVSGLSRKLSVLGKKAKVMESTNPPNASSVTARDDGRRASLLPKSFSNTSLPTFSRQDVPPVPRTVSAEKLRVPLPQSPRRRDELWSVFHALDGDFQKFQSKSIALKANVVRSSLLPFLRTYASHPSNWQLRSEDLDRRSTTLNKWWTGLLDMLSGRSGQSISGTDRPTILDGISGIMERPEWRPRSSMLHGSSNRLDDWTDRPNSRALKLPDTTDYLYESVHRNVHDIFVGNLLAQIILVVDKMSLKNAPASLVVFCGKSCAYAFLFCPSVADVLVRLWDITPSTLKRVMDGFNLSKTADYQETSDRVSSRFPTCLESLAFVSFRKLLQDLKMQPSLPSGTGHIQWHGYWVGRWSGKDSDLFYVFIKHYHLLIADFLPRNATKTERACLPGFLLVHAQLLTNLESTLHWQSTPLSPEPNFDPTLTFDELLGPDASASALPAPPANATRIMAENRLIMLLRDFLSEKTADRYASWLFADDFSTILDAAIRTTSLYDHNACFTLCDFLQEAFVILVRYEASTTLAQPILDCAFWINVFTRMVDSHNTMTEIRLYAFLYTIWSTIVTHETWKTDLCMRFLLEETFFYTRFNHWCPMVRAYFMRLLCWRIARADADASDRDIDILKTLMLRLNQSWSHYNYLALKAQEQKLPHLRPSTVPCHPAPGRRLLIIRTDTPATSSFILFNSAGRNRYTKAPAPAPIISAGPNPNQLIQKLASSPEKSIDPSKRRSGLFRAIMGYRGAADTRPSDATNSRLSSQSSTPEHSSAQSSRSPSPDRSRSSRASMYESSAARSARTSQDPSLPPSLSATPISLPPPRSSSNDSSDAGQSPRASPPNPPPYNGPAFFKFSLELVDRRPSGYPLDLHPPRLPLAPQLLLQQALQAAAATNSNTSINSNGTSNGTSTSKPPSTRDFATNRSRGSTTASASSTGKGLSLYRGPQAPRGPVEASSSRYTGRALAEWQLVVNECQNFFDRRRKEGVPANRLVETPTLSVESFRRPV